MRSIGARLAFWYAGAATLTLACLFVAGYYLLENQLVRGLDALNRSQYEQIKAHLGDDYAALTPQIIDARIRETANYASALFYITIDDRNSAVRPVFYSTNLRGQEIPDVKGRRVYNAKISRIGELRVAEFILGPFDVTIATSFNSVNEATEDYVEICIWLLLGMAAVSVAIGRGLSRLALRPVRLIRETASRISSDNLGERIPVADVRDEMSELAQLLNQMFDRLEKAFDEIRRFAAEASHELKTPLSMIRLQAERLLEKGGLSAANEESVQVQLEEVSRLTQTIEELLFLSRAEAREIELNLARQDPEEILANFLQDARVLLEHQGLNFLQSHSGSGEILAEPRWIRRVLLNVLTNAIKASPSDGTITLTSRVEAGQWQVALDDQGGGVPAEFREKIFERFYRLATGKGADESGTGLGLAICRSIVNLHRGKMWAEAAPGSTGLRVVFAIPIFG